MGISPMRRGDLAPNMTIPFVDDTGAIVNLTGVNAALSKLWMRDVRTGAQQQGAGVFSIPNPTSGQLVYQWASPDTATPGTWRVWATITWPSGAPQSCDEFDLLIT